MERRKTAERSRKVWRLALLVLALSAVSSAAAGVPWKPVVQKVDFVGTKGTTTWNYPYHHVKTTIHSASEVFKAQKVTHQIATVQISIDARADADTKVYVQAAAGAKLIEQDANVAGAVKTKLLDFPKGKTKKVVTWKLEVPSSKAMELELCTVQIWVIDWVTKGQIGFANFNPDKLDPGSDVC